MFVKNYLDAFARYFEIKGRTTRRQYWMFILFHTLAIFLLSVIDLVVLGNKIAVLYTIYLLVTVIPATTVAVRRMHDSGRSGWWVFLPVVSFVFLCWEGQLGSNRYGEDPDAVIQ
jgi:uncharacterized membrane protein YhaH (DUF805 family)